MRYCVCGHPEEAHLFGGQCRVPGCVCDRFWPIPEISDGDAGPYRGGITPPQPPAQPLPHVHPIHTRQWPGVTSSTSASRFPQRRCST